MTVRLQEERGASLLEFALVLPLLLMLVLGLVSAGIAYNHKVALTHAARETGRYGATLPVTNFLADPDPMGRWLDELAARTVQDATGTLGPSTPGFRTCVAFVHPNGSLATDSTRSRVEDPSNVVAYLSAECFSDGRPADERRVQVEVRRTTDFNVVFFQTTFALDSQAVSRYEAGPGF